MNGLFLFCYYFYGFSPFLELRYLFYSRSSHVSVDFEKLFSYLWMVCSYFCYNFNGLSPIFEVFLFSGSSLVSFVPIFISFFPSFLLEVLFLFVNGLFLFYWAFSFHLLLSWGICSISEDHMYVLFLFLKVFFLFWKVCSYFHYYFNGFEVFVLFQKFTCKFCSYFQKFCSLSPVSCSLKHMQYRFAVIYGPPCILMEFYIFWGIWSSSEDQM